MSEDVRVLAALSLLGLLELSHAQLFFFLLTVFWSLNHSLQELRVQIRRFSLLGGIGLVTGLDEFLLSRSRVTENGQISLLLAHIENIQCISILSAWPDHILCLWLAKVTHQPLVEIGLGFFEVKSILGIRPGSMVYRQNSGRSETGGLELTGHHKGLLSLDFNLEWSLIALRADNLPYMFKIVFVRVYVAPCHVSLFLHFLELILKCGV